MSSLGSETFEALVELLDASRRVENALFSGVKRVRFGGNFDVNHRVGVSVLPHGRL